jgi:glycosyltransferase involved in cell wall biosynthesis
MAELYQAADCYVSPYVAEGFGIPVLEAAACGLPVICTEGGPTDDFVSDEFALRIASTREELAQMQTGGAPPGIGLIPDMDHLIHLMLCTVDDADFREAARHAAPAYVQPFTWSRVVDRLLQVLLR